MLIKIIIVYTKITDNGIREHLAKKTTTNKQQQQQHINNAI